MALQEDLVHDKTLRLGQRTGRHQGDQVANLGLALVIVTCVANGPLDALGVPGGREEKRRRGRRESDGRDGGRQTVCLESPVKRTADGR